jgi:hypothetical protein
MISNATKRSILRWIHLIFTIPIIGYVYSPFAELPSYAPVVRFASVPVLILSGFWMYARVFFAIIGVALWLGAYQLSGYGRLSLVWSRYSSRGRFGWWFVRDNRKDRPNKMLQITPSLLVAAFTRTSGFASTHITPEVDDRIGLAELSR